MTQVLPLQTAPREPLAPDYQLGEAAGNRRPVTMFVDGEPLYGTLYEPTVAAARGQRVGVLILEQLSWHRMHHRLAQYLAASGYYALTFDFRSRGESAEADDWEMWQRHWLPTSMQEDVRQACATFRDLVPLERLIGYGYCQAGHAIAQLTREMDFAGLAFAAPVTIDDFFRENYRGVLSGLPDLYSAPDLNLFPHLDDWDGQLLLVHGGGDLFLSSSPLHLEIERAEAWEQAAPERAFELVTIQGADHTFASRPWESSVIEHTLAW